MRNSAVFLFLCLLFPLSALARPATTTPVEVVQPDGTKLTLQIMGDEFANWTETEDGYAVVQNPQSKTWEYALPRGGTATPDAAAQAGSATAAVATQGLVPSGLLPGRDAPPAASRHLRPQPDPNLQRRFQEGLERIRQDNRASRAMAATARGVPSEAEGQVDQPANASNPWTTNPVSGTKKMLIVLVNFANRQLVTTAAAWHAKVFDTTAGVKSAANFFKDNSHGKLTIVPVPQTQTSGNQGVVTVTIAANHPNSGKNFDYAQEVAWLNLALAQAAAHVDFAALDTNADGTITPSKAVIYFVPAGYETAVSPKQPSIWAHANSDDEQGPHVAISTASGSKRLTAWAMNGELNGADRQLPIGTLCHEMGHQLCGMPDLYDTTSYNNGLGIFSLMSYGVDGAESGEDDGTTPVAFDAWSRAYCVWDTTRLLPANSQTVTFGPALGDTTFKLVPRSSATEYFLAENRHLTGWDRGLWKWDNNYQGGLLILHVDNTIGTPGQGTYGENDINKYVADSHQGVVAARAGDCDMLAPQTGNDKCTGDSSVLYYSGHNTAFSPSSSPSTSNLYSGATSALGLTAISACGASMTARSISPNGAHLPSLLLLNSQ